LTSLREIIEALFNEIKAVLKGFVHETETALKERFKKILITSIIISILLALTISFVGSAPILTQIGSLEYLMTFMPALKSWYITGITSAVVGSMILLVLFLIVRKQLRSPQFNLRRKSENHIVSN